MHVVKRFAYFILTESILERKKKNWTYKKTFTNSLTLVGAVLSRPIRYLRAPFKCETVSAASASSPSWHEKWILVWLFFSSFDFFQSHLIIDKFNSGNSSSISRSRWCFGFLCINWEPGKEIQLIIAHFHHHTAPSTWWVCTSNWKKLFSQNWALCPKWVKLAIRKRKSSETINYYKIKFHVS